MMRHAVAMINVSNPHSTAQRDDTIIQFSLINYTMDMSQNAEHVSENSLVDTKVDSHR